MLTVVTCTHTLLLQYPQEKNVSLGTAQLAHEALPNSTLRAGLSWSNLAKALNWEKAPPVPALWAVLFFRGNADLEKLKSLLSASSKGRSDLLWIEPKKGAPLEPVPPSHPPLQGIVALDGTWSQAKTLWWRNPWLLKLKRLILVPARPSLYGRLRKEPRPECISTLESVAIVHSLLEGKPAIKEELLKRLREFLKPEEARPTGHPSG